MRKLWIAIILVLTILSVAYAWCQTDWRCVNDCTRQGYQWGLCKSICSWCN